MAEILSIGELLDLGGSASTAGLIPYSALEYSAQVITGISGSAIGGQGGTDSATVSAIASAYAESAASGKLDNSASGLWYPLTGNPSGFLTGVDLTPYAYASSVSGKVDQSAFDNCCSSMSSVVSSLETSVTSMSSVVSGLTGDYLEKSASSMFQPSGQYQTAGDYAYNSSVSSKLDASASSQFQPSGDYAYESALSSYIPVSASSQFAPSGDYAEASALSSKLDASASSQFQPSGNYQPSGDYQTAGNYMSASESSAFYPMTGNPSGFLVEHQSLTAYQDRSSISAWTGDMSSISGKLDQSAFTAYSSTVNNNITSIENNITAISSVVSGKADASSVHTYTGIDPIVVDNENDQISLSASAIQLDSTMTSYMSGGTGFIGVNGNITSQMTSFVTTADMSGYIPTSESSKYYSTGNPSAFATTAQLDSGLSGKLDSSSQVVTSTAGSSPYVTQINGSSISAKTADFAKRAQSAYFGGSSIPMSSIYYDIVDMQSAKLDSTANLVTSITTSTNYGNNSGITKINGSAILQAVHAGSADYVGVAYTARSAQVGQSTFVPMSAFAYESAVSSKLDASASSDFYSTSNPSGFLTSSYTPEFAYDAEDKISSIDGSAIAGGCAYTSPSGTLAIDNENGTIDVWNSSMRVDEHVTAASSFTGTAQQLYSSNNVGQWSSVWTGGTLPGDIAVFSAIYPREVPGDGYNVRAFGIKEGGGTAQLAEFSIAREPWSPYSGSATASASINEAYTSIYMLVSGTYGVPSTGQYQSSVSGITNVDRPGATASATAVYENVLKDSMWQSLTAWATSQGWTP